MTLRLKSWNVQRPHTVELKLEVDDAIAEDVLDALQLEGEQRLTVLLQVLSAHAPDVLPFDDWALAEAARIKEQNGP